jgi:hypothetical protein
MTTPLRVALYAAVIVMLFVVHPRMVLAQGDAGKALPGPVITQALGPEARASTTPSRSCDAWNAAGAVTLAAAAIAQGERGDRALWVVPGAASWHANRERAFNEVHAGLGAEWQARPTVAVLAGAHCNSNERASVYAAATWQPVAWQLASTTVRPGIAAGLATGYRDGNTPVLRAGPMVALEGRTWGINVTGAPRIGSIDGFVAVQLKVRIS